MAYLGDATTEGTAPTVGVSITPWVIALLAAVYLLPKMYHVHRVTRRDKKEG